MSLIDTIKTKQVAARKSGDTVAASLYTTLLGEAAMIGKNAGNRDTTDAEVVAVVQKFLKNLNETVQALRIRGQSVETQLTEQTLLTAFLPRQLSESELVELVQKNAHLGMPGFMKLLKENYAGQYDGKLASQVAKRHF
jgi:uncharacterized protein YqeY